MIFHLDCNVECLVTTDREELEELFSKLGEADRDGRHFFISQRTVCEWATDCLDLSGRDRAHLATIREQYSTRHNLLSSALAHVKVLLGSNSVRFDGEKTFSIGHRLLIQGEYLLRSASLVVEDSASDGLFYKHIFGEVGNLCAVPSIRFEPVHGGGSGIVRAFESEVAHKRVVVCVVDNDKLAPSDQMSDPARVILLRHRRGNFEDGVEAECFIGLALETIGRELENYIPYSVLRLVPQYRAYPHYGQIERILSREAYVFSEDNFWLYFDLKAGLCGARIRQKCESGRMSEQAVLWICQKLSIEECNLDAVHVLGFGERIIDAFLECDEALGEFHTCVRREDWRSVYCEYFENVLWFLAAPIPERT